MTTYINCPKCDDELEFSVSNDTEGDGVYTRQVTFVELEKQNCVCELSESEMDNLRNQADENVSDARQNHYADY